MYNFVRRFNSTKKAFDDLSSIGQGPDSIREQAEKFIILARTVTFILQKDLSGQAEFKSWYATKQKELADKFGYFVSIRNVIEKEGRSPIRSGMITLDFQYQGNDIEKIGHTINPDGTREDTLGKMTHTHYFDKEHEKEVIRTCEEYLSSLGSLISEALEKFPQIEN